MDAEKGLMGRCAVTSPQSWADDAGWLTGGARVDESEER